MYNTLARRALLVQRHYSFAQRSSSFFVTNLEQVADKKNAVVAVTTDAAVDNMLAVMKVVENKLARRQLPRNLSCTVSVGAGPVQLSLTQNFEPSGSVL